MSRDLWAGVAATIAVVATGILGFHVLGGPSNQRLVQADLRTVRQLSELARQINVTWSTEGKTLPGDLTHFPGAGKQDPVSGRPFRYHPKSSEEYELCATFATDSRNVPKDNTADPWIHPKGEYCFEFHASQPVPYPPYSY
jgi:hypothetical protein